MLRLYGDEDGLDGGGYFDIGDPKSIVPMRHGASPNKRSGRSANRLTGRIAFFPHH
jgi:hypothetical protein